MRGGLPSGSSGWGIPERRRAVTTAYYLWDDVRPGAPASSGPGAGEPDLGHLLDLLYADMAATIQIRPRGVALARVLRRGLTLRRWLRRVAFAHGD